MSTWSRRELLLAAGCASLGLACGTLGGASEAIGPLLPPSALAARLADVKTGKLALFYVGPDLLYDLGHIPGARRLGPVSEPAGRRALEAALRSVPAETDIVLYCGCCPIAHCPNIRPASAMLRALGRTNAYWLDLPTKLATDWADKGYPIEPA